MDGVFCETFRYVTVPCSPQKTLPLIKTEHLLTLNYLEAATFMNQFGSK